MESRGRDTRGGHGGGRGGGRGRGRGGGRGREQYDYHVQSQRGSPSSSDRGGSRSTTYGTPATQQGRGGNPGQVPDLTFGSFSQMTISERGEGSSSGSHGGGAWGRGRGLSFVSVQSRGPQPDPVIPKEKSCKIVAQLPPMSSSEGKERILPVKRPDSGGSYQLAIRRVKLLVNHFSVNFNNDGLIRHYDIEIKADGLNGKVKKAHLSMIREQLFSSDPRSFPLEKTAYDGEKNIFSAIRLPEGKFTVEFSEAEDSKPVLYTITIQLVSELKLRKLKEYLMGNVNSNPRDILQGMDLVIKQNPSRKMISVGRSFYRADRQTDLGRAIVAAEGFQQSLKPTSQGLSLCLDYSVLSLRKKMPVIDFLEEHIPNFSMETFAKMRRQVEDALKKLKVTVTHRKTKQKYTIESLSDRNTQDICFQFQVDDQAPKMVMLVDYFKEKYGKEIRHKKIPCLELNKVKGKNQVPMEFCVLIEGQRYPKENLDNYSAKRLKQMSLPAPYERRERISDMVKSRDGPCGGLFLQNFEMQVDTNMTTVEGRVIPPPTLKLGGRNAITVNKERCQWNLVGNRVVDGKTVDRWAIADFTSNERFDRLKPNIFIPRFIERCQNLGIQINDHPLYETARMTEFSSANKLQQRIEGIKKQLGGQLQILLCVMSRKDDGYKTLKWLCETKLGVVTQCCLSSHANEAKDQYLANLAMKMNSKLGGSNTELNEKLQRFENESHVMFVGADVNHPKSHDASSPSIAAVVATVNWPGANRYAARVRPQAHRKEKILNFGDMCLDLIQTYARINKAKPQRIVVFRDGVSEGQFDMVLNEELMDLKRAIAVEKNYNPTITLIVARKRHQTRLFPGNRESGGSNGNVFPGTVVDKKIVHPFEFDFFLCSHHGSLGTSKPTHYHVLWDEHRFTSDQLQKLIYDLCFTFARCTKSVSLVPPVYYADLVAYRGRMYAETLLPENLMDESFYRLHVELEDVMYFV